MPFNPDEAAKKLGLSTEIQAAGSAAKFDPDRAAQSLGLETLPNEGNIEEGPSAAKAFANSFGQGGSLGFGDEIGAAANAMFPTETDKALNRNFSDRYAMSRDVLRKDLKQSEEAHPIVSALSEIAGSIPTAVVTGTAPTASLAKVAGVAGLQGAAYGLGKSNKETVSQALYDSATSGLLSAGLAGAGKAASQFVKDLPQAGLKNSFDEFGNQLGPIKATTTKEGDILLKYGVGMKDSYKLGKEMGAALSDPNVQSQITMELAAQPEKIAATIKSTKDTLGQQWAPLLKEHGAVPTDVHSAFAKTYDKIDGLFTEGNEPAQKLKEAFRNQVKTVEDSLRAKSPSGSLKDVPLAAAADAQEQLGQLVYQQKAFQHIPSVNGTAKSFFGDLAKAFNHADETVGSGGDLSNINKMFSVLYKMDENALSGAAVKTLATDPQAVGAAARYKEFIKPWAELPKDLREGLGAPLDTYLKSDFQKSLVKAQVMSAVTGRGVQNKDVAFGLSKLPIIKHLNPYSIANRLGANAASTTAAPPSAISLGSFSPTRAAAPVLGSLSVDNQDQPSNGSLQEIK